MSDNVTTLPTTAVNVAAQQQAQLTARFRELHAKIVACETGDYTKLLPGYDLIPQHERQGRLLAALQAAVKESAEILFKLQSSSTGPKRPKKATAATTPAKPKLSLEDL